MSSATSARWSMPLVCTALLLEGGKERPQGGYEPLRVLAGDVVSRLDRDELQARVGGLHFLHRLGGVEIGARAAHGEQRAAHLADQLPHVDPKLRFFWVSELISKISVALEAQIGIEVGLEARAVALPEILHGVFDRGELVGRVGHGLRHALCARRRVLGRVVDQREARNALRMLGGGVSGAASANRVGGETRAIHAEVSVTFKLIM